MRTKSAFSPEERLSILQESQREGQTATTFPIQDAYKSSTSPATTSSNPKQTARCFYTNTWSRAH